MAAGQASQPVAAIEVTKDGVTSSRCQLHCASQSAPATSARSGTPRRGGRAEVDGRLVDELRAADPDLHRGVAVAERHERAADPVRARRLERLPAGPAGAGLPDPAGAPALAAVPRVRLDVDALTAALRERRGARLRRGARREGEGDGGDAEAHRREITARARPGYRRVPGPAPGCWSWRPRRLRRLPWTCRPPRSTSSRSPRRGSRASGTRSRARSRPGATARPRRSGGWPGPSGSRGC